MEVSSSTTGETSNVSTFVTGACFSSTSTLTTGDTIGCITELSSLIISEFGVDSTGAMAKDGEDEVG